MKGNVLTTLISMVAVQLMALSAFAGGAKIGIETDVTALQVGQDQTLRVFVDTSDPIGAYQFEISYDPSVLEIIDVQAGADGFVTASSMERGLLKVNGFDVNGKGPGELEFLLVKVKARAAGDVGITVNPVVLTDVNCQGLMVSGSDLALSVE